MKSSMTITEKHSTSTDFVTKLDLSFDVEKLVDEYNNFYSLLNEQNLQDFNGYNQLGLKHRKDASNVYMDSVGSLYDKKQKKFIAKEEDFCEYNPNIGLYTKSVIQDIERQANVKIGRARYIKLLPKTGLSIHFDMEERLHIVLKTNENSLFGNYTGEKGREAWCTHIPADGSVYKVDTTQKHFVYNGGWEDRIHIVLCIT